MKSPVCVVDYDEETNTMGGDFLMDVDMLTQVAAFVVQTAIANGATLEAVLKLVKSCGESKVTEWGILPPVVIRGNAG